jgi:DNA replication and repair protein RecF
MYVERASFENFRNLKSLDLVLNQGFVVLTGDNGAGKTNFLEAVYLAATFRRFPDSDISQLFQAGQDFFRLRLRTHNSEQTEMELFMQKQKDKHMARFKVNNQEISRPQYARYLSVISFLPQDLMLLTRSPGGRRRYLNEALANTSVEYRHASLQYEKSLQQRNELWQKIKIGQAARGDLEIWDEKLAEFGSQICRHRKEFLDYLNTHLPGVLTALSPDLIGTKFVYSMSGSLDQNEFLKTLQSLRMAEQERGITLCGPHRDDFYAEINGRRATGFVSRGQMRSISLALKILEKQFLTEKSGQAPLMLLDDVFSEFDRAHQKRLVDFLLSFEQVFISTTHAEEIKEYLPVGVTLFKVESGKVT